MCLLHESDLAPFQSDPDGLSIEHWIARSSGDGESLADVYDNCLWVCKHCNSSRRNSPVRREDGVALLNPTTDIWREHFERVGHEIRPKLEDRDAEYTAKVYGINDERRVGRRRWRAEELPALREELAELESEIRERDGRIAMLNREPTTDSLTEAVRNRNRLAAKALRVIAKIEHFSAIPRGVARGCRCEAETASATAVSAQWQEFRPPSIRKCPLATRRFRS